MQSCWSRNQAGVSFFIIFSLFLLAKSNAQTISDGTALNIAGKQRMLVERVAKDFVCKSLNLQKEKAIKEQATSTILFEEHLSILNTYAVNDAIKQKIALASKSWQEFKTVLEYKVMNQQNAAYVFQESDKLLKLCDDVVNAIVIQIISKKSSLDKSPLRKELIASHTNSSGKMRMLVQRTALYYICYYQGITQKPHEQELINTVDFIQFSLKEIKNSPINDEEVNGAILGVEAEWKIFVDAFQKEQKFDFSNKSITPESIFDLSNRLVNKIDKVTLAYAKMLDN